MKVLLDLSEGEEAPITADVIAILFEEGRRLFAAKARVDDAPWYGLIHEDSTALVQVE
jgi:hypothetical protein